MHDPKQRERLAEMHDTIAALRIELVQREREAGELLDGEDAATEASMRAAATRMMLDAEKDRYIALAEALLSRQCSVHGPSTLMVSCPECVARNPELRPREMGEAAA